MEKKPKRAKSHLAPKDKSRFAKFQVERILENVSDSFVALDTNWIYTYVNEKAAQTFGRTREQLIGKHIWTEFPEGIGQPFYKAYYKAVETGQPIFVEEYYPPYDRWFENRIYPSRDGLLIFFHDITDHKKAEEKLRGSEERFRALTESASDLILIISADGNISYVSPSVQSVSGYHEDEILGRNISEFIHEDDIPQAMRALASRSQISGQAPAPIELRFRHRDETWRVVEILGNNLLGLPAVAGIVLNARDITKRKQAEVTLQEAETKYRTLIEQIPNTVTYIDSADPNVGTEYVSPQIKKILGYTSEEWQANPRIWQSHIHPEDQSAILAMNQRHDETGESMTKEYRMITRSGAVVWIYDSATMLRDEEGKPLFSHGIMVDITERKQADEKIRSYLNQLTALNKAALQLQKLHSPEVLANEIIQALESILNYTYGAVLLIDESGERLMPFALSAQKQNPLFVEQDKKYVESADIRVGKGITGWVAKTGQSIRLGDVRQDDRYFGIRDDIRSELCVPLKAGERVIGVINMESTQADAYSESDERVLETVAAQVSVAIQNSQLFEQVQKQTAELERRVLERTAQLQSANKELESFSYSVSHDLRAPLRAISGFAEIIARRHRADLNEEGQHYFDNIIQASERMGHLIEDLLTYSRLGRSGLRLEPVSLSGLLADLAKDLKGQIDELHGTIRIAEDLPDVTGDRTLLIQIFTNLLENAVKYRKVDVPPQIKVACQLEGNHVIFSVKDNGIGIPAEYQDKIFNIFQRLHSEEEYPGTGIGLATTKKSVELLGGEVWVESQVGKGSTFYVRLLGG